MADPIFTLTTLNPFGLEDVGFYANPIFADIDGDGDLDTFVGEYDGGMVFFRNNGTRNMPEFGFPISNPFGLGIVREYAHPSLVDIDGDGDLDLFIGRGGYYHAGEKFFFENTGTSAIPEFAAPIINPFGLDYDGYRASPTFVDIDDDGDQDAFVGEANGNTLFFRNTGTANNPVFAAASTNPFGLIDVGYNANPAFVDIDGDGDQDAFVGKEDGSTLFFRNTGAANNPVFAAAGTNPFGLIDIGLESSPSFADIDNDGDQDAFVGERGGNIIFFVNNGLLLTSTAGNDVLTGTPSLNDSATYANATAGITVSLLINTQQNTIGAGRDTLVDIENLVGSNFNDDLTGNAGHNVLTGRAGNDILRGWSGADTMIGGLGNDTYLVENVGDIVTENLNQGTDTVSSRLTYTLPANVERLILTGTSAINGTGNGLANVITGNSAANQLNGGSGNDTLDGGLGNNRLTGGNGNDIFKFTTKNHVDIIADYNVANDTMQLENSIFTALTATGTLPAGQFRIGAQAVDANDFIIYNNTTGALLYDANGNGAGAAVQIATLSAGLGLTNADIVVI